MPQARWDSITATWVPRKLGVNRKPTRNVEALMAEHDRLPPEWRALSNYDSGHRVAKWFHTGQPIAVATEILRKKGKFI